MACKKAISIMKVYSLQSNPLENARFFSKMRTEKTEDNLSIFLLLVVRSKLLVDGFVKLLRLPTTKNQYLTFYSRFLPI